MRDEQPHTEPILLGDKRQVFEIVEKVTAAENRQEDEEGGEDNSAQTEEFYVGVSVLRHS
tara:strand:- start:2267 stop:2446 length:180 start_codon:yes stop_codon:yes gene_type:complete